MMFSIHERCCVPEHLQCEMFHTMTHIDKQLRRGGNKWVDQVVIDYVPFLYYLQYLVYRQLKEYEAMWTQQSIYLLTAGCRRTSLMKPMLSTNSQYRSTPGTISPTGTRSNTKENVQELSLIGSSAT